MKKRELKKLRRAETRLREDHHKVFQRLKDRHDVFGAHMGRYQGRWRFVPERPFEFRFTSYPQLVCAEPGVVR